MHPTQSHSNRDAAGLAGRLELRMPTAVRRLLFGMLLLLLVQLLLNALLWIRLFPAPVWHACAGVPEQPHLEDQAQEDPDMHDLLPRCMCMLMVVLVFTPTFKIRRDILKLLFEGIGCSGL